MIERFNGIYRKEVLNAHLFSDLNQVRDQTQRWVWDYNHVRPRESLGNKPPIIFNKQRGINLPSLRQTVRRRMYIDYRFALGGLTDPNSILLECYCPWGENDNGVHSVIFIFIWVVFLSRIILNSQSSSV